MSKPLAYLLCMLLALQGGLGLFVQQQHLSAIKATLHYDTELICTGDQMKWISISLTQQLGQFVFVDAPDNVNEHMLDNACPTGAMSDMQTAVALISDAVHSSFIRYVAVRRVLEQRPYTAFAYQSAQSRAPPRV